MKGSARIHARLRGKKPKLTVIKQITTSASHFISYWKPQSPKEEARKLQKVECIRIHVIWFYRCIKNLSPSFLIEANSTPEGGGYERDPVPVPNFSALHARMLY